MIMMMSCLQDPADGRAKLLRPPQRQRQQTGAAATTAAGATLRINIQLGDQNKLTWRGQYLPDLRPHTWQVGDERRSIPERPFGNTLLQGDNDSPGRNRPADANGDQGGEESIWQNSPDKREQLHLNSNFDGLLSTEGEQTPFCHPNAHDELSVLKGSKITKKISSIFARASCCSKRPRAASHHQHCLLLLLVVLAASLTCFHNAQTCSGFGLAEWDHDPGLTGHPNPNVKPHQPDERRLDQSSSSPSPRPSNDNYWDKIMSLTWGRFSQDDSAIAPREQAAPSTWTSLLNPFGPRPPTQQNTGGGGGGGGGDDLDNHIKRILVPRVSGTPGNVEVREYIVDELRKNDYHVELDEFTGATPVGKVKFANIIGSSNPNACRQLVLACHYDSKMLDGFLGAVDSAVPCAMLLKMSDTFGKSFRASGEPPGSQADSLGLQFIFFDGEEAFVQWTSTDSLYGSRHLAAKWAKQAAPAGQCGANVKSKLDQIELFVLLDLIGASDSSFVMYNAQLRHHYEALQRYEKAALAALTHLNQLQKRRATAFKSQTLPANFVEDDHVPFMKRNVPILLLLAHPFPKVWHTIDDNYEAIDFPKTRRVLHVLEEFVANYQPSRRP